MNEIQSRYIDKIAVEKLLNTKLSKVQHSPFDDTDTLPGNVFYDYKDIGKYPANMCVESFDTFTRYSFDSQYRSGFLENDRAIIDYYSVDDPIGSILFIHGVYDESIDLYQRFIELLRARRFNLYFFTLPFHYDRKPSSSLYSGEFFFCANLFRTTNALKQAVYDCYQGLNYINEHNDGPVLTIGFSSGAAVCMNMISHFHNESDGIVIINPVCTFSRVIWSRSLCKTIKADLERAGVSFAELDRSYSYLNPIDLDHNNINSEKLLLITGQYDMINDIADYDELASCWPFSQRLDFKAGHLNIFAVPRLIGDIEQFYLRHSF